MATAAVMVMVDLTAIAVPAGVASQSRQAWGGSFVSSGLGNKIASIFCKNQVQQSLNGNASTPREGDMLPRLWKVAVFAVLTALVATPALSQGLNRRADLISPQSGHADPGDLVMDINVTEALPNVFGAPDIFGRRRPAGRIVVQYLGIQNGTAYFSRQSTAISSNETTMTRTPLFIPNSSQTIVSGQIGTQTFSGTATTSGTRIVGPRPHSESQVGFCLLRLASRSGACCALKDWRFAFCGSTTTVQLITPSLSVLRVNSAPRCFSRGTERSRDG